MMLVDCQTCPVRDLHCADCVVTALGQLPFPTRSAPPERHLLGVDGSRSSHDIDSRPTTRSAPLDEHRPGPDPDPESVPLDRAERRAVSILATVGLVDPEVANHARAVLDRAQRSTRMPVDRAHRRAM